MAMKRQVKILLLERRNSRSYRILCELQGQFKVYTDQLHVTQRARHLEPLLAWPTEEQSVRTMLFPNEDPGLTDRVGTLGIRFATSKCKTLLRNCIGLKPKSVVTR